MVLRFMSFRADVIVLVQCSLCLKPLLALFTWRIVWCYYVMKGLFCWFCLVSCSTEAFASAFAAKVTGVILLKLLFCFQQKSYQEHQD